MWFPTRLAERRLAVFEGGLGFGFLALVISYLPVIYQAFSRREVNIVLLDARAGSPPTAAELLRRHTGPGGSKLSSGCFVIGRGGRRNYSRATFPIQLSVIFDPNTVTNHGWARSLPCSIPAHF